MVVTNQIGGYKICCSCTPFLQEQVNSNEYNKDPITVI